MKKKFESKEIIELENLYNAIKNKDKSLKTKRRLKKYLADEYSYLPNVSVTVNDDLSANIRASFKFQVPFIPE